jgi:hypothetical protein
VLLVHVRRCRMRHPRDHNPCFIHVRHRRLRHPRDSRARAQLTREPTRLTRAHARHTPAPTRSKCDTPKPARHGQAHTTHAHAHANPHDTRVPECSPLFFSMTPQQIGVEQVDCLFDSDIYHSLNQLESIQKGIIFITQDITWD